MAVVSLREAKARLSELLDRASAGEVVEIERKGAKPGRFRILAGGGDAPLRKAGALKGKFSIPDDFDDTDDEIVAMFEDQ